MASARSAWTAALSKSPSGPAEPGRPRRVKESTSLAAIARSVAKPPSQAERLSRYLCDIARMEEVDSKFRPAR